MRRATSRSLALLVALCFVPTTAHAFDSNCTRSGETCSPGPDAGRGRWVGPTDEHRQLFELTMVFAGLPDETQVPLLLEVFTNGDEVFIDGESERSTIPAAFGEIKASVERAMSVAEFAQLPDFGYSLFDWVLGLETCPADTIDAVSCHEFSGHMGALNSNHFMPQAQAFYRHYHALALARAGECREMAGPDGLGDDASRFLPFLFDCEKEALLLEAVAHHYLQDAWSSGHMWQRWGSPNIADFPSLLRGLVVGAVSGVIHGAKALLQPLVGGSVSEPVADIDDAMCAPHPEVEWSLASVGRHVGLGDLYLPTLYEDEAFVAQSTQLFACAVAGVREVYLATGQAHGPLGEPSGPGPLSIDPTSDACFGQRVTNRALRKGLGLDLTLASGAEINIPISPGIAASVVGVPGATGLGALASADPEETALVGAQLAYDLVIMSSRLDFESAQDPFGTTMAEGGLGPLLGIDPNGAYLSDPPAPYADPPLPWTYSEAGPTDPTLALLRTFHRAHARDWCEAFSGELELDALRSGIDLLTTAIDDLAEGDPVRADLEAERDAVCGGCAEFVERHLRFGTEDDYDVDQEPLCAFFANDATPYVYTPRSPILAAGDPARWWCGCGIGRWAITGYDDQGDLSAFYAGAVLHFESSGRVTLSNETGVLSTGVYVLRRGDADLDGTTADILDLTGLPDPILSEFEEEWIVTAYNEEAGTLELLEKVSNSPPEMMRLTRIDP